MNFLSDRLCTKRLIEEYKKYNGLIVAYDYDNTVFDYHKKGYDFDKIIKLLRECRALGCTLIVYTCSKVCRYDEIKRYLTENDIPYDYINENSPKIDFAYGKLYYNIFLDDRCGLKSAYKQLNKCVKIIKKNKRRNNYEN